MEAYEEFGSLTSFLKKRCFHPKYREEITDLYAHGACRKYVDSPDICCGFEKHTLYWKLISGEFEQVEDPMDSLNYSNEVLELTECFVEQVKEFKGGVHVKDVSLLVRSLTVDAVKMITCLSKYLTFDNAGILYHRFSKNLATGEELKTNAEVLILLREFCIV